jgi:hypothetical protein
MRLFLKMLAAAAIIGPFAGQALAAPAGGPHESNAAPFKQLVQAFPDDPFGGFCPAGQFYSCWVEPYGRRFCGCWWNGDRPACPSGYHFTCRIAPDRRYTCGCY